jgi:hypothetical protein
MRATDSTPCHPKQKHAGHAQCHRGQPAAAATWSLQITAYSRQAACSSKTKDESAEASLRAARYALEIVAFRPTDIDVLVYKKERPHMICSRSSKKSDGAGNGIRTRE